MDRLTKEQRHKNMIGNKSKGTKIELLLGKMMWNAGIRYRKNDSTLPGTPDFSIRSAHVAVFCDGEFWHGHNWEERKNDIKSNREFWYAKIERNIRHDALVNQQLEVMGWKVFRFWEDDIRHEPDRCLRDVLDYIQVLRNDHSSVSDIYGTASNDVSLYGRHSYNRDGSIMSVNDQMAVITHYVNNNVNNISSVDKLPYADEAYGLIQDISEEGNICNMVSEEDIESTLRKYTFKAKYKGPDDPRFTFIDLFAGLGGMRLAMQKEGGRCVFASEWDSEAVKHYYSNFGVAPFGDITKEETKIYVPKNADILAAALPIQAFALSNKRNIEDRIKGTLFAETAEVIRRCEPMAVLLELPAAQLTLNHNKYFNIIKETFEYLQYNLVENIVFNARDFDHALDREYLYLIAFRNKECAAMFSLPKTSDNDVCFADIKETNVVSARYFLKEKTAQKAINSPHLIHDKDKVRLYRDTIVKDAMTMENMPHTEKLDKLNRMGLRRMTPLEMLRTLGFPDDYILKSSYNQIQRMISSATPVNIVRSLTREITRCLEREKHCRKYPKIK